MLVNNQLCIYGKSALLCQNNGFPHLHFPKSRSATLPAIRRRAIYGMMKTGFSFVLLPSCLVLLAACSPAPSDRIAKNMPAYEQLPKEHQAKVARGELEKECLPWRFCWHGGNPNRKWRAG